MEAEDLCEFVRLSPDGAPVVRIAGVEREVEIAGIEVSQPPPSSYVELFNERISRLGKPLRCLVQAELPHGRIRAQLLYFGWQDKSGDVWLDLAETLVKEGAARVAKG